LAGTAGMNCRYNRGTHNIVVAVEAIALIVDVGVTSAHEEA